MVSSYVSAATPCMKFPFPVEGKFDLIVLGYCLEELFPETHKGMAAGPKGVDPQLIALSVSSRDDFYLSKVP